MTFGRRHRVLDGVGSIQSGRRKVSTWEPGGPVSRSFVWGAAISLDNSINASQTGRGSSAKPFALWPTVKLIPQGATIEIKRLNWLSGFHSGILAMEPCVYMNLIIHKISQAQTKEKPPSFTWWPEPWSLAPYYHERVWTHVFHRASRSPFSCNTVEEGDFSLSWQGCTWPATESLRTSLSSSLGTEQNRKVMKGEYGI